MTRLIALTFWGQPRFVVAGGSGDTHSPHEAHGHGAHDVRESPRVMTLPLIILAIGATISGFAGVPPSLGGSNRFEQWLEPVIWQAGFGIRDWSLLPLPPNP